MNSADDRLSSTSKLPQESDDTKRALTIQPRRRLIQEQQQLWLSSQLNTNGQPLPLLDPKAGYNSILKLPELQQIDDCVHIRQLLRTGDMPFLTKDRGELECLADSRRVIVQILFFLFMSSWGQWICAFAPSFTVISNILPFFFVMFSLFNGVVRPYAQLPVFWRYWMYYVNPSTYWIGGVLAATLSGIPVACTPEETGRFDPPPGQTCGSYAGAFAGSAGGYLLDENATAGCEYCPYSTGDQYLATLNVSPGDKWPYFGIFLAFCFSNWALVYFFIYTVRIRGWSFGFGMLFGGLGKLVDKVKSLGKKKTEE